MFLGRLKSGGKRSWSALSSSLLFVRRRFPGARSMLFVLPYDLLEEIATTYFSCCEAAALLTVNSQFHAAFSRVVWRTLDASKSSVKYQPDAAWLHYGHLVRSISARFYEIRFHMRWLAKLSNLTELTLHLDHPSSATTDGLELLNLRCIRFVTYEIEWTASDVTKCMELVHQLEQRNKSLLVRWELVLTTDEHIAALDTIVNRIDDTSRYSLSITYLVRRPLVVSQFSKLSRILVKLDTSDQNGHFKDFLRHCSRSHGNHGNNTGCTFPRLAALQLYLQNGLAEDRFMASAVTPAHFPSLRAMQFRLSDEICHLPGFSVRVSHSWSTITELRFLSSSDGNVVSQALKQVPNLERLVFEWCRLELEIASIATHLPRLSYLELGTMVRLVGARLEGGSNADVYNAHAPMVRLKDIAFRFREEYGSNGEVIASIELLLQFIFRGGAPGLRSLEFKGIGPVDWTVYTLKHGPQVNRAVRTLILPGRILGFGVRGTPEMSTMFPNLQFLRVGECAAATRKRLLRQYLQLVITVEPM
ncbi:hypothetical protein GQ42DRAFT_86324 [Ramicandelaber brevisporus]|nr:hypothetical protein GQ42DRAFT_86324 [Ramicandelaber brevisporus]